METLSPLDYDGFSQEVPRLLRHMQDYVYLQSHPLCGSLCRPDEGAAPGYQAQALRRLLLETIDRLSPPPSTPTDSREWRGHHILTARYIEGRSVEELTAELSISQRQFYREHSQAIEAVSRSLWEHYTRHGSEEAVPANEALAQEATRLARRVEPIDLTDLVEGVMLAMTNLAQERGVSLSSQVSVDAPIVANRTLLRQAILQTLSHLLDQPPTEQLILQAKPAQHEVGISITAICARGRCEALAQSVDWQGAASLTRILGGEWLPPETAGDRVVVRFTLPLERSRLILVIEDNPSAVQLVRRYLAEEPYQVLSASLGLEALALIEERVPDVIILDVMLPGRDGWELLQSFRQRPATADVPILMASVLAETRLAESLGASGYLKKPYTQAELLGALRRLSLG